MKIVAGAMVLTIGCLLLSSCSGDKPKQDSGVTLAPASGGGAGSAPAASSEQGQQQLNVCSFFSEADAQSIFGAPMKRSDKTNPQRNCMFEEVKARPNSLSAGTITLTLSQSKSVEDENRDWANLKEVRHLHAGQKNTRALSGIGDEAWFTGNTEKGRVGVAAVIARKGKSELMLDSMVLEYVASPDAMKKVAKRVADQLQ